MLIFLLLGVFIIAMVCCKPFRVFILHFPKSAIIGIRDLYYYFMRKMFNIAPYGFIDCYCAEFGGGKTLSATNRVIQLYNRYNNKKVFHPELKKMVTQKIQILSNVHLNNVPYIKLISMEQFIKACEIKHKEDIENNTLTITYLIGDEFSSQMNSRNFKTNIPTSLLNKILTSRHYFCSWFITSQRFNQIDKLVRESTRYVFQCSKHWRVLLHDKFYAWEMENTNNPLILEPISTDCVWVTDTMYNNYNTFDCVDNLLEDWKNGNYLSDDEVLKLREPSTPDTDSVHLKRKFLRWKNKHK